MWSPRGRKAEAARIRRGPPFFAKYYVIRHSEPVNGSELRSLRGPRSHTSAVHVVIRTLKLPTAGRVRRAIYRSSRSISPSRLVTFNVRLMLLIWRRTV